MKNKQLIVLLVIVTCLLALYALQRIQQNHRDRLNSSVQSLMPEDFDTARIAAIVFSHDGNTINIEKKDEVWTVRERSGYPADLPALQRFFIELCDTQIAQVLALDEAQKTDMKLDEQAIRMILKDENGTELRSLAFGRRHETKNDDNQPQNPYMMMAGGNGMTATGRFLRLDSGQCITVANTFDCVDNQAADWLSKDFFRVSAPQSVSLKSSEGTILWTVSRTERNQELQLEGEQVPEGQVLDSAKVSAIKGMFSWLRFTDVAAPDTSSDLLAMVKPCILTIRDFDGPEYQIAVGQVVDGHQYLKVQVIWNGQAVRQPVDGESEEDRVKNDEAFAAAVAASQKKASELNSRLSPWFYQVDAQMLSRLPLERSGFFKAAE